MTLSIIGAGFGRTGTHSMKEALEVLGCGPCHHMVEVLSKPDQLAKWRSIADGTTPDWDDVLGAYNSSLDWPSAYYWRELAEHFPKAKVLLTVRSAESWYTSFSKTILEGIGPDSDPNSFGLKIIRNKVFDGRPEDKGHAIAAYEKNNASVRSSVAPDRLLVYQVGDGWEPLCKFLGVDVPAIPYPVSNSTEEFRQRILKK